jgi:hypothetical protein
MSFFADKVVSEALTFDSLLITPYWSEVLRSKSLLSFRFVSKTSMK